MLSPSECVLVTVVIDNGFKGRQFVLYDECDIALFGLKEPNVVVAWKTGKPLFGMEMTRLPRDQITPRMNQPYDDIKALFKTDKRYFTPRFRVVVGKVVVPGPYKGLTFSLFGMKEIASFFAYASIWDVIYGRLETHRGCTFKSLTHREGIPLHGKMTKEIAEYLKEYPNQRVPKRKPKEV